MTDEVVALKQQVAEVKDNGVLLTSFDLPEEVLQGLSKDATKDLEAGKETLTLLSIALNGDRKSKPAYSYFYTRTRSKGEVRIINGGKIQVDLGTIVGHVFEARKQVGHQRQNRQGCHRPTII